LPTPWDHIPDSLVWPHVRCTVTNTLQSTQHTLFLLQLLLVDPLCACSGLINLQFRSNTDGLGEELTYSGAASFYDTFSITRWLFRAVSISGRGFDVHFHSFELGSDELEGEDSDLFIARPLLQTAQCPLGIDTALNFNPIDLPVLERIRHLLERAPLDTLMSVDPLNQPLMHHKDLRLTADLRVDADREDEVVVLAVAELELFFPEAFDLVGVDEASAA